MGQACRQKEACCCEKSDDSLRAEQSKLVTGSRWDSEVAGTKDLERRGFTNADGSRSGWAAARFSASSDTEHGLRRTSDDSGLNGRESQSAFGGTFAEAASDICEGYQAASGAAGAAVNKANNYFGYGLEELRLPARGDNPARGEREAEILPPVRPPVLWSTCILPSIVAPLI